MNDFLNNGKVLISSRYDENPLKPRYITRSMKTSVRVSLGREGKGGMKRVILEWVQAIGMMAMRANLVRRERHPGWRCR